MNIRQVLENTAQKYSNKPAIVFKNTIISFKELQENVLKLAGALRSQGIGKSDKVAIYLPNCPQYVYSYLACFTLGAIGVPLDYMLKKDELISCLSHCEAKVLIAQENNEVSLEFVAGGVSSLATIIFCGQRRDPAPSAPESHARPESPTQTPNIFLSFDELLARSSVDFPSVNIQDQDPSLIMYTSGTTGQPKGILLNYKHLEGSPRAMEHFVDLTDGDTKLCALPLSHIAGLIYIQNCILFGITLVLMDRFHPLEFLKNIAQYKITCFHIVPAMYTAILLLKQIEKFDLSSLRWVVVFGAPSSPETLRRFQQYCPNAQLLNGWGMTETCPPNTVTPLGSKKIESVGKPSPFCEIKILDEDGQEVPTGEIGEIVIRGWIVMDGYYKDPEITFQMKRNGWLYTGDLGRFDREGFLYIVGRKKEMIKVAGQIVYAPEVEAAFQKHEAVAEAAVIGVPDSLRGETVKAFVVLKENMKIPSEDLRYFAREHLAHFKVPQSIEIRGSLPKNRTGKIDKELLKQEALI